MEWFASCAESLSRVLPRQSARAGHILISELLVLLLLIRLNLAVVAEATQLPRPTTCIFQVAIASLLVIVPQTERMALLYINEHVSTL